MFLFSRQGKSCLLNVFKSAPQSALLTYGLVCGCFGRGRAVVFSLLSNPKKMINFAEILRLCLQKRSSERNLRVYGVKY